MFFNFNISLDSEFLRDVPPSIGQNIIQFVLQVSSLDNLYHYLALAKN